MPTETINWNSIVGGTSAVLPAGPVDTGEVIATMNPNAGSSGYVTVNTTATDPDNDPSNPDNSQVSMTASTTSPTSLGVGFADDTGSPGVYGAYNATFGINDIDAGSSSGFRDQVTISATDTAGNPLSISVSPNSGYTVTTNPDGSVTILANPNTNSWNSPNHYAQVTINGGPIGNISVVLENVGAAGTNNIMLTNVNYETNPICFATGTLIETDRGEVAVEDLVVGDLVRTLDNGYQPIRWIGVNSLSGESLIAAEVLRPVRIAAGALGDGRPKADLIVSPQHRVLVRSRIARKMFDASEVLVAAKQLVILDGIDFCTPEDGVTYVHFMCDQHEVVFANGSESETLYTGPVALRTVGSAARREILEIFPELADIDYKALSVRPLASGRMARRLAMRHKQNSKSLVM